MRLLAARPFPIASSSGTSRCTRRRTLVLHFLARVRPGAAPATMSYTASTPQPPLGSGGALPVRQSAAGKRSDPPDDAPNDQHLSFKPPKRKRLPKVRSMRSPLISCASFLTGLYMLHRHATRVTRANVDAMEWVSNYCSGFEKPADQLLAIFFQNINIAPCGNWYARLRVFLLLLPIS